MTAFCDIVPCNLVEVDALMMEALCTSESLASFLQTTRRNIPEDSRCRENLESHESFYILILC